GCHRKHGWHTPRRELRSARDKGRRNPVEPKRQIAEPEPPAGGKRRDDATRLRKRCVEEPNQHCECKHVEKRQLKWRLSEDGYGASEERQAAPLPWAPVAHPDVQAR